MKKKIKYDFFLELKSKKIFLLDGMFIQNRRKQNNNLKKIQFINLSKVYFVQNKNAVLN